MVPQVPLVPVVPQVPLVPVVPQVPLVPVVPQVPLVPVAPRFFRFMWFPWFLCFPDSAGCCVHLELPFIITVIIALCMQLIGRTEDLGLYYAGKCW